MNISFTTNNNPSGPLNSAKNFMKKLRRQHRKDLLVDKFNKQLEEYRIINGLQV